LIIYARQLFLLAFGFQLFGPSVADEGLFPEIYTRIQRTYFGIPC